MDRGNILLYLVGGALLVVYLIQRPQGYTLPSSLQSNLKLPITLHSDGHYYDANGVFVS
jgi:hypothetical protein